MKGQGGQWGQVGEYCMAGDVGGCKLVTSQRATASNRPAASCRAPPAWAHRQACSGAAEQCSPAVSSTTSAPVSKIAMLSPTLATVSVSPFTTAAVSVHPVAGQAGRRAGGLRRAGSVVGVAVPRRQGALLLPHCTPTPAPAIHCRHPRSPDWKKCLQMASSVATKVRARACSTAVSLAGPPPSCCSSSMGSMRLVCRAAALPLWPSATAYREMPQAKAWPCCTTATSCKGWQGGEQAAA